MSPVGLAVYVTGGDEGSRCSCSRVISVAVNMSMCSERQYITFIPLHVSSDMHLHTLYAVYTCVTTGCYIKQCLHEFSVKISVNRRLHNYMRCADACNVLPRHPSSITTCRWVRVEWLQAVLCAVPRDCDRTLLTGSFVLGEKMRDGKIGSIAHAPPNVFRPFKTVHSVKLWRCFQRSKCFWKGTTLSGCSEVSLAATMSCRLQLCTVSGSWDDKLSDLYYTRV